MAMGNIKIIECPRDAMQGIHEFIPTEKKISYINGLLKVGFDTLDFGSFVSPKAIPQMADTHEVMESIDVSSQTKLLAIVANERGAEDASGYDAIRYMGYPFSISETFQQRNTNASIAESGERVKRIASICQASGQELVVYISMGFGNPYGDPWNADLVAEWTEKLVTMGVSIISFADTVGVADAETITYLFKNIVPKFPEVEFGAHLHATPANWQEKVEAAYQAGCKRFDGAIKGYGGCPMAEDELVGNMATENLIAYLSEQGEVLELDMESFNRSMIEAGSVFP
jgi:hydroxymethylglutaryl-CoA lyase